MQGATGDSKGRACKVQTPRSKIFVGECSNRPLCKHIVPRRACLCSFSLSILTDHLYHQSSGVLGADGDRCHQFLDTRWRTNLRNEAPNRSEGCDTWRGIRQGNDLEDHKDIDRSSHV